MRYVKNTGVSAPFTKPAVSDFEGKFGLEFAGVEAGLIVKVSVEKAGRITYFRNREEVICKAYNYGPCFLEGT